MPALASVASMITAAAANPLGQAAIGYGLNNISNNEQRESQSRLIKEQEDTQNRLNASNNNFSLNNLLGDSRLGNIQAMQGSNPERSSSLMSLLNNSSLSKETDLSGSELLRNLNNRRSV